MKPGRSSGEALPVRRDKFEGQFGEPFAQAGSFQGKRHSPGLAELDRLLFEEREGGEVRRGPQPDQAEDGECQKPREDNEQRDRKPDAVPIDRVQECHTTRSFSKAGKKFELAIPRSLLRGHHLRSSPLDGAD